MSTVGSRDTAPEIKVRRMLYDEGYRYRLHAKDLPGSPDIVFRQRKKVIFVHGCFWHGHGCKLGKLPKSKREYWKPKIDANKKRDKRNLQELERLGWKALVIWQCKLQNNDEVREEMKNFLGPTRMK